MTDNAQDRLDALVIRVKKVRRWLVTLAVLRVAALCLIFVSAYIGVYAWLDHRSNFGQTSRITALILLIAGLALLLHRLTKLLLGHISCSAAANYIENKRSFDQQLVTAIEYYENKQDYPYSSALAEHLVLQVERDSAGYRFDAVVQKWQGYVLGVIITFGLVVTGFYVKDNYVYFASYFTRLIRPMASVKALSPTHLESVTKDLVAEPDSEVTFLAEIEGRVPETVDLVVISLEPESTEGKGEQTSEQIQTNPTGGNLKAEGFGDGSDQAIPKLRLRLPPTENGESTRFEASRSFSQPGQFKYRFEVGSNSTPWHTLNISPAPEIEGMTAEVTPPRKPPRNKGAKSYTELIENNTLEVLPGSNVTLKVQATDKLKEVIATDLDGKPMAKNLDGTDQFTFHFKADKSGSVHFDLVNEKGLTNNDLPGLEVIVKADEPPKFELISPEGDYLATDVASVPVTFDVTDDFGLESVEMNLEIPGQKATKLAIPIEEGIRSKTLTHTIELEKYNLSIGDSVLFYARATDIDTGSTPANRTSSSEVYFIEIRPYRQNWRPKSGGKPSPNGMPAPEELLNILEYTRSIVKKTWAIAEKPNLADPDRSALKSIDNDVRYCAEQLALIRDDSDYGFQEPQKAVLNTVLWNFEQASKYLAGYDAASAMTPEKNAYRILRKFILELELELNPPQSGQSLQEEKPDSVKMQEQPPEYALMETERVEGELKQMQQKLDKLSKEQKVLKRTFKNFLEKEGENKKERPRVQQVAHPTGEKQNGAKDQQGRASSQQQGEQPSSDQKNQNSQSAGGSQSDSEGQTSPENQSPSGSPRAGDKQSNKENQQQSQAPGEDKSASSGQSPGEGKQSSQSRDESQTYGSNPSNKANTDLRLRMLQAKQKILREQVSQLKRDLQQLPQSS